MIVRAHDLGGTVRTLDPLDAGRKRFEPATEADKRQMINAWAGSQGNAIERQHVLAWLETMTTQ